MRLLPVKYLILVSEKDNNSILITTVVISLLISILSIITTSKFIKSDATSELPPNKVKFVSERIHGEINIASDNQVGYEVDGLNNIMIANN